MKMNSKFTKVLILALAVMLLVAQAVPAMAIDASSDQGSTSVDITKNLILGQYGVVPKDKTFTFTLVGDNTGSSNDFKVHAGTVKGVTVAAKTGTSYTADVTGTYAEDTSTETITVKFGTNNDPAASTSGTTKTVAKVFTIDFTGVTFTEPGVYRYKLTETTDNAYTTTNGTLYIDVYVEYKELTSAPEATYAENLTIGSILVHTGETYSGAGTTQNTGKNEGNVDNNTISYDLTLEKEVTGNQGSQTQFFTFTVVLTNVPDGTYTISGANGDASSGNTPATTITVSQGTGTATVYLKHGQKITIEDLPKGAKYTITETSATGYTTAIELDGDGSADVTSTPGDLKVEEKSEDGMSGDTDVTYINTRNGVIPTGVLMTIAPFVALILVGVLGAAIVLKKKRG